MRPTMRFVPVKSEETQGAALNFPLIGDEDRGGWHVVVGGAGAEDHEVEPVLESQPVSRDYGEMRDAVSACWRISGRPGKLSWEVKAGHG